jgi:hypothetical protein
VCTGSSRCGEGSRSASWLGRGREHEIIVFHLKTPAPGAVCFLLDRLGKKFLEDTRKVSIFSH